MYQILTYILVIIVFIVFNQLICLSAEHVYYSEPDLTNPNIPEELRESCGYRYGQHIYTIKYSKTCFSKSYADRKMLIHYKKDGMNFTRTSSRVLGGRDVTHREAPWVVQIAKRQYSIFGNFHSIIGHCTGVLITMKHILTAAHCKADYLRVYVGSDESLKGWYTDEYDFIKHPKSKPCAQVPCDYPDYDIAIIVLKTPIDWEKEANDQYLIRTICLPLKEDFSDPKFADKYFTYRKATIFGWGQYGVRKSPAIIQRGDYLVKYMKNDIRFISFISNGDSDDARACKGDSGSGVVQYLDEYETRAVLIGIHHMSAKEIKDKPTSCDFEHQGESKDLRVVQYLDWINEILQQN